MNLQEIQSALKSPDEETRRSALPELRRFSLCDTCPQIFTAMGDASWRVRKEAVELFVGSSPDARRIGDALELLRNEENAGLRNSAAEALIRFGSLAAVPLINHVKDPDPDVRKVVVDVMGAIADPLFVPQLRDALHDPDINVASAAAEQLGSLGDPRVIPELLLAMNSQDNMLFRFSVLGALSVLAAPAPVPAELLELAGQKMLRRAVFDCLGSISDDGSVPLLLDGLADPQGSCRAAALKALFKIHRRSGGAVRQRMKNSLLALKGSAVVPLLCEIHVNHDVILTEAFIWFSAATEDDRLLPMLIDASSDERYAKDALDALKKFGHEALAGLVSRYSTLDENRRSVLCSLIGKCGYATYADLVESSRYDPAASVRKAAAYAAGKLGLASSVQALAILVDDEDPDVSAAAVAALQELSFLNRQSLLETANCFSCSPSSRHRQVSALLLASLGERERLPLLIKDEDPQVRKSAVAALGTFYHSSSASVLMMALTDEDPDVRIAVAEALGGSNDAGALNPLEHALVDTDVWVQCSVLRAIAGISSERAFLIIARICEKAEGLLMITCLQLLEAIGGPTSGKN